MGYTQRLLWFWSALGPQNFSGDLYTYGELFAGERAWSRGMSMMGYEGKKFDSEYEEFANGIFKTDFLTPFGFLCVFKHIMSMHVGGVFLAACPCWSWIFMTRYSTGRHLNPLGAVEQWKVRAQNALVARIVYLLVLCIKRGVFWLVEQPWSSILFEHPRWKWLMRRYGHLIEWIDSDMGAYTMDCVKPSVWVGTVPYLGDIVRNLAPAGKRLVRRNPARKQTSITYLDSNGKKRCQGGNDLHGTQAYAMGFGCQHSLAYSESCHHHVRAKQPGHDLIVDPDSDSEIGDDDEECFGDFKHGFGFFYADTLATASSSSSHDTAGCPR